MLGYNYKCPTLKIHLESSSVPTYFLSIFSNTSNLDEKISVGGLKISM